MKMAQEELERSEVKNKRLHKCKAKKRVFQGYETVLTFLSTDDNKLLMQWRVPYNVKRCQGEIIISDVTIPNFVTIPIRVPIPH